MNEDLKTIAQLAQELGVTRQAVYQKIRNNIELSKNISKFTVKEKNKTLYDLQAQNLIKQAFENGVSVNSKVNVDSKLIDVLQAQIEYLKADKEQERRERQAIYVKALQLQDEKDTLQIELQKYKAIEEKKEAEQAQIAELTAEVKELKAKAEQAQTDKQQAEQVAAALTARVKELETAAAQEPQKKKSWLSRLLRKA